MQNQDPVRADEGLVVTKGLVFQDIEEDRGFYYVRYVPAYSGALFASLQLTFLEKKLPRTVGALMEKECTEWMQRYPIPLMVTAFDDIGNVMPLQGVYGCDHLIAIMSEGTPQFHWRLLVNTEFPDGILRDEMLLKVYSGLGVTTKVERERNAIKSAKRIRYGIIVIALWGVAVPVSVELIGIANPMLGYLIIGYSIWKAVWRALKMLGYVERTEGEKKQDAEELRMRHHHYHCELNPEGFLRLKVENFEKETREQHHLEAERIRQLR